MAFPSSNDTFSNPQGTTQLATDDHANQHRTEGSAIVAIETKIGLSSSTPAANLALIGSGVGTSAWGSVWNLAQLGTATLGTPTINSPTIAGGTWGTVVINGGTISSIKITQHSIGSAVYTGTIGGTITLDPGTATRLLVNLPNSSGSLTIAVTNVIANQPFWAEFVQGTAGNGTLGWFSTIRWADGTPPVQIFTANKKDTFVFIPTSGTTFDGYIAGQGL